MKNFIIAFILFSTSVNAQQKTVTDEVLETTDAVVETVKSIGEIFKKKDKNQTEEETTNEKRTQDKTDGKGKQSEFIDESIVKLIKAEIASENDENFSETKDSVMFFYDSGSDYMSTYLEFSKRKNENVFGDLNGDGKDEAVITVHKDGGRPNMQFYEIYVFTQKNNKWIMAAINNNYNSIVQKNPEEDICSSVLIPYEIKDGFLKAKMTCLGELDALCCPSQIFDVTLKLESNKLVFVKKELLKSK